MDSTSLIGPVMGGDEYFVILKRHSLKNQFNFSHQEAYNEGKQQLKADEHVGSQIGRLWEDGERCLNLV